MRWTSSRTRQDPEVILEALMEQDLLRTYFHPGVFCQTARRFETTCSGDPSLPQGPLLEAVADLVDGLAEGVALHGAHWCLAELRRRRELAGGIGFSQLLQRLDPGPAPQDPRHRRFSVPRSGPLLQAVGAGYDVALVDEFQDTDPIQWRILWRSFGQGQHQLVMVGDPKQAIYRFRGGDLNTYRRAREQARRRFSLNRNFRATPQLIGALNTLMAPGPQGEPGLRRSELAVPPVLAHSRRRGPPGPPIQLLWLGSGRAAGGKLPSRGALERGLRDPIADHILQLLGRSLPLGEADGDGTISTGPLEEKDLCLLVGNHRQAEQLRGALESRGIASRLVSKADVFASPAATALQRFLDALADPADADRLRLLAASAIRTGCRAACNNMAVLLKYKADLDDYKAIMVQAVADRLAEAFAELMHERARQDWVFGQSEGLSKEEMIAENYRGIRPAAGYPACPDHTEKQTLFELLEAEKNTGVELTTSFAMTPGASVSGLYFAHPEARYFAVDRITKDQVESYAQRKGKPIDEIERWLGPNLAYDPS